MFILFLGNPGCVCCLLASRCVYLFCVFFPGSRSDYFVFWPADVFIKLSACRCGFHSFAPKFFELAECLLYLQPADMFVITSAFVSCLLYFSRQTFSRSANVFAIFFAPIFTDLPVRI